MEMLLEPSHATNEWPVEEENGRNAATFAWPRTRMPVLVKKKKKSKGGWSDCSHSQWLVNPALESGLCSGYAQNMWLLLWRNEPLNYRYQIVTTEDCAAETTLPTSDGNCCSASPVLMKSRPVSTLFLLKYNYLCFN